MPKLNHLNFSHLLNYDRGSLKVILSLFFTEKPRLEKKLGLETLGEIGKELEIPCNVQGTPEPEITWYRDAEPLDSIQAVRYNIAENGSLVINYMRREDSGMFQCSASNQAGYTTSYTWLRVKSKFNTSHYISINLITVAMVTIYL